MRLNNAELTKSIHEQYTFTFNPNFAPEREYSSNAKLFAYEIFPQFVEILKSELEK